MVRWVLSEFSNLTTYFGFFVTIHKFYVAISTSPYLYPSHFIVLYAPYTL
jgi:hypothetical protein